MNKRDIKSGIYFIVEDNSFYAKTLQVFLQANFPSAKEVLVFSVGEACLPQLHRDPDVIILDYFLDGVDAEAETGLEIIREIREEKPEMNIILISSQDKPDVYKKAVENYHCQFVKKDARTFEAIQDLINQI